MTDIESEAFRRSLEGTIANAIRQAITRVLTAGIAEVAQGVRAHDRHNPLTHVMALRDALAQAMAAEFGVLTAAPDEWFQEAISGALATTCMTALSEEVLGQSGDERTDHLVNGTSGEA